MLSDWESACVSDRLLETSSCSGYAGDDSTLNLPRRHAARQKFASTLRARRSHRTALFAFKTFPTDSLSFFNFGRQQVVALRYAIRCPDSLPKCVPGDCDVDVLRHQLYRSLKWNSKVSRPSSNGLVAREK